MKVFDIFRALKIDAPATFLQSEAKKIAARLKKQYYKTLRNDTEKNKPEKKILIVANLGGIGNCIAATPLLIAIRTVFPKAYIVFLAVKGDLFENWCVPNLIIDDKEQLPNIEFDITFISYWGYPNPPKWVDSIKTKRLLKTKVWLNSWFLKPERDYNVDLARKFGFKGKTPPEFVCIKKPQFLLPEKIIAILPCSNNDPRWQSKRWQYFGKLTKKLLNEFDEYAIVVLGTETDLVSGIDFSDKVLDLRGSLSLAETAFVLKKSYFAVGNDCGPAHIADCVGTNTFVIFGPTCPIKNAYINKSTHIVSNTKCSPCQYDAPPKCDNICTKQISIKYIVDLIKKVSKKKAVV